jgi:hypothetical protein
MISRARISLLLLALLGLFVPFRSTLAQQPSAPAPAQVVQIVGLVGVKNHTKGTLAVENGSLRFAHAKANQDVAASSIFDVITGDDSQRVFRGTVGTLTMFAPYESGRFLSLFRTKLDTLTIKYHDADGAVHGAIFTMPTGSAFRIKKDLLAQGAQTSVPLEDPVTPPSVKSSGSKEQKP